MHTISLHAKANDDRGSLVRKVRMMSESFTSMYVGNMKLDERNVDSQERVSDSDGGVGVGTYE